MRKTTTIVAILAILTLVTTGIAFGWGQQGPWGGRGPGYGPCQGGEMRGLATLNLTADQESRLASLR
ncbi:MAG TPA: hypothetical protein PKV74_08670, partial [Syntrophales bacterium]|nr:hypothetical protein [Syntrophales bacterium]